MDDVRLGRIARALRRRRGWRQADLAERVGCHQTTVSRFERGHAGTLSFRLIRRLFQALDASFEGTIRWRGGEIERLLDQHHAGVVEQVAALLVGLGWTVLPEVTYSEYGERGSIDLLTVREAERSAAIFEVKVELTAVEGTLRKHAEKTRLAPGIVEAACGWRPTSVARILVIAEGNTARRTIERHRTTFRAVYPASSRAVRGWLGQPTGSIAGIWFLSPKHRGSGSRARGGAVRVRRRREASGWAWRAAPTARRGLVDLTMTPRMLGWRKSRQNNPAASSTCLRGGQAPGHEWWQAPGACPAGAWPPDHCSVGAPRASR
jgi:transcriptional regulator with XRE-family HTH domain